MPKLKTTRLKVKRMFMTVADIGSLFLSLVYIVFVGMMLITRFGNLILNFIMLGITLLYIGFFIFKIAYLNRHFATTSNRIKRRVKISIKYTKLAMRLTNAVFVVISLVNVRVSAGELTGAGHVLQIIGIVIVVTSFAIAMLVDVILWYARRKFKELRHSWRDMSEEEKRERLSFVFQTLIKSLDNVTIDDYLVEAGKEAAQSIGDKFRQTDRNPQIIDYEGT